MTKQKNKISFSGFINAEGAQKESLYILCHPWILYLYNIDILTLNIGIWVQLPLSISPSCTDGDLCWWTECMHFTRLRWQGYPHRPTSGSTVASKGFSYGQNLKVIEPPGWWGAMMKWPFLLVVRWCWLSGCLRQIVDTWTNRSTRISLIITGFIVLGWSGSPVCLPFEVGSPRPPCPQGATVGRNWGVNRNPTNDPPVPRTRNTEGMRAARERVRILLLETLTWSMPCRL